eukprot:15476780-Alexandrium_andersonii.AAC.4
MPAVSVAKTVPAEARKGSIKTFRRLVKRRKNTYRYTRARGRARRCQELGRCGGGAGLALEDAAQCPVDPGKGPG